MIRDTLKQFFVYGAGSIAQTGLGFVLLPLFLRFFGPDEYGIISLLLVVNILITVLANVGIMSGLFRLYYETERREKKKLVGMTWLWHLLGATVGGAILFTLAPWFSQILFRTEDYSYAVRLLGALFFSSFILSTPFNVLRLEKKAGFYVGFSLFKFAVDFALKFYFIAFLKKGIGGYFESGIIANVVVLCSLLPFVLRYVSFSLNTSFLKQLLKLGFPFIFSTISIWSLTMSDRFILGYFHGEAVVGIYSVAYKFANLFNVLLFVPSALFWSPVYLSYAAERSAEETKRLLSRALIWFFLPSCFLYLAISLGGGDILRIFTFVLGAKKEYWLAASLVPVLTLGPFLYLLSDRATNALLLAKKPKFTAIAACAAALANIGLNLIFIPKFSALGAAINTVIAYVLFIILSYWWAQRTWPVDYNWKGLAKGFLILAIAFMIGWQIEISQPWVSLFVRMTIGIAVFGLLTWFASGILTKAEQDKLLSYLKDGRRRLAAVLSHRS